MPKEGDEYCVRRPMGTQQYLSMKITIQLNAVQGLGQTSGQI